jgi:hypothetical protein
MAEARGRGFASVETGGMSKAPESLTNAANRDAPTDHAKQMEK